MATDILPQNLQNLNVTFHIASGEIKSKVIEYILLKKPLGALKLPFDESWYIQDKREYL